MITNTKSRLNLTSSAFGKRMLNLAGKVLIGLMALGIFASTLANAQSADPYAFEKKAYKPDGTPWSGPVNVGDTVKYVLSYKPGAANSGPATIFDTLSPNQSYAAPTTGPGWAWGATPYSAGNSETYSSAGFGPGTGSVKITIPGPSTPSSGSGDGTVPIPISSLNKVFGIFHHTGTLADGKIDCWTLPALSKCPGYPKPNATTNIIRTSLTPQAVVVGTKIYFSGIDLNGKASFGCFDGALDSACAHTPTGLNGIDRGKVGGLADGGAGRMLMVVGSNVVCKVDTGSSLINCPGWSGESVNAVTGSPSADYASDDAYIVSEFSASPSRVYSHHGDGVVQCTEIANGNNCAGWPAAGVDVGTMGTSFSSLPKSGSSGDGGVCLWSLDNGVTGCVSDTGSLVSTSAAPLNARILSSLRIPGTAKVLFPSYAGDVKGPKCYDFTGGVAASCGALYPISPPPSTQTYGMAMDPSKPESCVLVLGHDNLMWRFDHVTGEVGCSPISVTTPSIDSLYCSGKPDPSKFNWTNLTTTTPGANGSLTVTDGAHTQTYTVSGGAIGVIPTSFTPGAKLTFSYTPNGASPVSIDIVVGYTSDKNPEICYQAKVTKCGPVFNDAVFKASFNGTAVNSSKRVDLGLAKGPSCDVVDPPKDTASCLTADPKVTCGRTPGTYVITLKTSSNGPLDPDFVKLTPKTAGVTIVNPQVVYPVIGGVVKITVAGANPGDVVEFDMAGTIIDAGSVAGSDLCCNGPIKITIPKDLDCVGKKLVDLAIKKTGGTTPAPDVGAYAFNMAVTNVGAPFNGTNAVTVTDVVPAGMTFNTATGTDWACATLPAAAGSTLTCTYTGAGPVSAGQSMGSIAITATASGKAPFPPFTNCAVVGTLASSPYADTNPTNNKSCVTVKKPDPSTINVTKVCTPAKHVWIGDLPPKKNMPPNGYLADCKITVTTTGTVSGPISVSEVLTGAGTVKYMGSADPWVCVPPTVPGNAPMNCTLAANTMTGPSDTSVINVKVVFTNAGDAKEAKNCAEVAVNGKPVEKACTPFVVEDPKKPEVAITKVCEPARQMESPVLQFGAKCTITVTTTGPVQSQIVVKDTLSGNGQVTSFTNTSTPAWTCTATQCDMNGANLNQTSSVSTFDAFVTFPAGQGGEQASAKNCAVLGVDAHAAGESCADIKAVDDKFNLDVKKDCSGVIALTANGPWAGTCKITVTATGGPRPPFISFSENLVDTNTNVSPVFGPGSLQMTDPWVCTAASASGPLGCTIPGSSFPASGTSEIMVPVSVPIGILAGEAKNCVKAFGAADAQGQTPSNPPVTTAEVCVPLPGGKVTPPPPPGDGTLAVTKVCDPAVQTPGALGYTAVCHLTVTASGSLPPLIQISDNLVGPSASNPNILSMTTMTSAQNWQYPALPVPQGTPSGGAAAPAILTLPSADLIAAGGTSIIDVTVAFKDAGWVAETQNCAQASGVTAAGQNPADLTAPQQCVQFTVSPPPSAQCGDAVLTAPEQCDDGNTANTDACLNICTSATCGDGVVRAGVEQCDDGNSSPNDGCTNTCTLPIISPPPAKPVVTVEKTCTGSPEQADQDTDGINDTFTCQIKVTVTGGSGSGDLYIEDIVADATNNLAPVATIQSMTSSDPWNCNWNGPIVGSASAKYCTIPVAALTSGTSIINVVMADNPQGNPGPYFNCARHGNWPGLISNPDGSNVSCARIDGLLPAQQVIIPACDPATATNAGDLCRCRFDNMTPVSKTACQCKPGFTLKAGQGCIKKVVEPKCDPATTVTRNGKCVCEYKNMVQTSATACGCAKGFKFTPGKGCFKPEPVCKQGTKLNPARGRCEPICQKGFDYNVKRNACIQQRPDCPEGTVYNPKRNRCDPVQPVCRKPFVYDAKRNACVEQIQRCGPGQFRVGNRCVRVPKCGFGQIPVPGTGICVSIGGGGFGGGGGGGGRPKDTCVPSPGNECQ